MTGLNDKVAVVTGGASGIGAATAATLAAGGAAVVVADIQGDGANDVAESIRAAGGRAVGVRADVSDETQIADMITTAETEFGGLDILHNNAAMLGADIMQRDLQIADADADLWESVLRVNLVGYVLAAKHAIPAMRRRGGGVIVNTSSGTSLQSELSRPAYGTSKAAINALTRTIATQYGRENIRCVALALGLVATPGLEQAMPEGPIRDLFMRHFPIARLIEPAEIGEIVAFMASDAAAMITGVTIPVDGGFSIHTPTFADELDLLAQMQAQ